MNQNKDSAFNKNPRNRLQ